MTFTRREMVTSGAVATLVGATSSRALAALLDTTASQEMGPFYPVVKPIDQDADLTMIRGQRARAAGQPIEVLGRVLDTNGRPISHARLEIWQANAVGRYRHPADSNSAPIDPNFQGYAALLTDAQGRYRFRTVKPGAYPTAPGVFRTPHIHFDITTSEQKRVTQMYFPGEQLNDKDEILSVLRRAGVERTVLSKQVAALPEDPGARAYRWDIVMAG
jgi:protocatechuate 3,4-dioxygenase, beta subunit